MKYLLVIMSLLALNAQAADEILEARKEISNDLNSTVKELKKKLAVVDNTLSSARSDIKKVKKDAEHLSEVTAELELNPTVLKHGEKTLRPCNDNEELYWDNAWKCRAPTYATDCLAASDEYKYEVDGKSICTRYAKNKPIEYKWEYRGVTPSCQSNTYKRKVYRCYYVDKNGKEVDVDIAKCGKSDELGENTSRCTATWRKEFTHSVRNGCSARFYYYSVWCPANHYCPGRRPSSRSSVSSGSDNC